jgi:hypothetical protein
MQAGREWKIVSLRAQYEELSVVFCEVLCVILWGSMCYSVRLFVLFCEVLCVILWGSLTTFRLLGKGFTKSHYQLHRDWLALYLQRTKPFPQGRFSQNFIFMIYTKIGHQILILVKMGQNNRKLRWRFNYFYMLYLYNWNRLRSLWSMKRIWRNNQSTYISPFAMWRYLSVYERINTTSRIKYKKQGSSSETAEINDHRPTR